MGPQIDAAWALLRAAAGAAPSLEASARPAFFRATAAGDLSPAPPGEAALIWQPESGWRTSVPGDVAADSLLDLYLPICSGTPGRPLVVGHLGQSLDGFIATHSGDSQFVTGAANIVHLHRVRALCDAVVVGAGTVAADDPQLTTRHVPGPNPLRVVFDPDRRLDARYRLFTDEAAPTLYICAAALVAAGETHLGSAGVVPLPGDEPRSPASLARVLALLRERGCARIFVEGGGVTVSRFVQAGLVDRLHVAIAPLIIGDGRPAIRLDAPLRLRDCRRPTYRVFRMGGDMLFDCDLRAEAADAGDDQQVTRII